MRQSRVTLLASLALSLPYVTAVQAMADTFHFGMWAYHINSDYTINSKLLGFTYKDWYAAEFINSYATQSYTVGRLKTIKRKQQHHYEMELGLRYGLIYGYDERFNHIAGMLPVLPYVGFVADFSYRNMGIEISNDAFLIASAGFFYRF